MTPPPSPIETDRLRITAAIAGRDDGTDPFVAAVRATHMPMIVTDPHQPDNPVVFANDAFCHLSGYERAEVLGRNCRFLQGPDTDRRTTRRIRDAVAAGDAIEIDIRNYRKNGEPFWNRLMVSPVRDAAGDIAYFVASQADVTLERERVAGLESRNAALAAELNERLRHQGESEQRMRFAARAGRLGTWDLDLATSTLTTSPLCRTMFGRPANMPFGYADMRAALHPDDAARVDASFREGLPPGSDFGLECRVVRGAATGWVELRAEVERDETGAPQRITGVALDITDRKVTGIRTRALVELDDRFRALDDPVDLAYAAAEVLGRTLDVSRAGYGTIDPVAETITVERDWNAPGITTIAGTLKFREHGSYIDDLKRGETVVCTDAYADPRTSATADVLTAISARAFINMPVTEQGGFVALLYLNHATARQWPADELAFLREVALRTRMAVERRRAEQALAQAAASLEQQVIARTEELMRAEEALRQSQKMEAVGQLTGGIAHDFNNLLTGISGSLELLKSRIAQGRVADIDRYATAAQGAAARAAALTHRLLAFSRRQTLEPKVVGVNKLFAGMEDLIRRTMGPAISLEFAGSAGLWNTQVDPSQLENAILNLCINARDAMPDGGRLTIETANRWFDDRTARSRDLKAGQYVSLCVSDTGTGMTPDVIARAFDPFFTTKPIGQGTGLGLSMIYGFAKQSEGQVRIYSEPGAGTQVCIYLPRHLGSAEEAGTPPETGEAPRADAGETVLVVDDEPSIRMLVTDVLEELGYATIEAQDGPDGLRVLRSDARIDLLVTDVGLPGGMNGRQVADAGRVLRPGLKVLFITGYAENAAVGHGHLEPGMQILTKPFPMEALASRIRDMIQGG